MIGDVLSIFRQVIFGLKTFNFTFGDFNFTAYQALIGIAVLTIACKVVWSTIFEKRVGLVSNSANFEKDAMRLAQQNIKDDQQKAYDRKVQIYANNIRQEIEAKRDINEYKRKVFFDKVKHFIIHKEV